MAKTKTLYTGYLPRKHQEDLHAKLKRFSVLVCHRRFGKTVFSINEMLDQGLRCARKNPQYAYIAPNYGQAKRVAWEFFKEFTNVCPGRVVNEAELRIDIPRAQTGDKVRYILLGAENPVSLKGIYLDGVILDEFAEMFPSIWGEVIRPALSDREGWAIFIGTPKGQNHFYDTYELAGNDPNTWFRTIYKASETDIVPASELEAAGKEMSREEYAQEFECSFSAAMVGAFYGKEMEEAELTERITHVPHTKNSPVYTAWDLGIDDTTVVWFIQEIGKEIHAIDYFEASGMGLPEIVSELNKRPYVYGDHYFPHDVAVRELGNNGESREKTLRDLGLRHVRKGKKHTGGMFMDSIHAVRLSIGKMWFDRVKCDKGIKSLRNYERAWDAKQKIFQSRPKHNWASHAADALREFADQHLDSSRRPDYRNLPRQAQGAYDIFS